MPAQERAPLERPRVVVRASDAPLPVSAPRPRLETLHGVGIDRARAGGRRPATLRPDVDELLADGYRDEAVRILAHATWNGADAPPWRCRS